MDMSESTQLRPISPSTTPDGAESSGSRNRLFRELEKISKQSMTISSSIVHGFAVLRPLDTSLRRQILNHISVSSDGADGTSCTYLKK